MHFFLVEASLPISCQACSRTLPICEPQGFEPYPTTKQAHGWASFFCSGLSAQRFSGSCRQGIALVSSLFYSFKFISLCAISRGVNSIYLFYERVYSWKKWFSPFSLMCPTGWMKISPLKGNVARGINMSKGLNENLTLKRRHATSDEHVKRVKWKFYLKRKKMSHGLNILIGSNLVQSGISYA